MSQESEFRVEKRRAEAILTLTTGTAVRGCFFLAGSRASHGGPERVADLLNADASPYTVLYNRSQLVLVTLLEDTIEAQLDPGYSVATERSVRIMLSNGESIEGNVRVYRPTGRDRLSDYARLPDAFRYVETQDATVIVNSAHIVELREISEA